MLRHVRGVGPAAVADDVFSGTPPIAFTFGLGAQVLFPMRFGAAMAPTSPPALLDTIRTHGVTTLFTAPTGYRALLSEEIPASLHTCVSAGEPLPAAVSDAWFEKTGHPHHRRDRLDRDAAHLHRARRRRRPGPARAGGRCPATRRGSSTTTCSTLPPDAVGRLAVRGPTGCRYLDDPRQSTYVRDGWNLTGDAFSMDADGYFWFQARTDDMIISSGYNISGFEVEAALLEHPLVAECAVVAAPDDAARPRRQGLRGGERAGRGEGPAGPREGARSRPTSTRA